MLRIRDILQEIERHAPLWLQESFDNSGVQVGDVNQPAQSALLCLNILRKTCCICMGFAKIGRAHV